MMKMECKRELNLYELIKWAWENDEDGCFPAVESKRIAVSIQRGYVNINHGDRPPNENTRFEVAEMVEINEDTVLEKAFEIYMTGFGCTIGEVYAERASVCRNSSISNIVDRRKGTKTTHIYYMHEDGTMTLIWERDEVTGGCTHQGDPAVQ